VACTGGYPLMPPVEGIDLPHVKNATEILLKPSLAGKARNIVIIGGGSIGCEVAHSLAYEMDKTVTVIEMLPLFMKNVIAATRSQLLYSLHKKGVPLMNCTRVNRIEKDKVIVLQNQHKNVPDPYNSWEIPLPENVPNPLAKKIGNNEKEITLPADLVIIATGIKPDDGLYEECLKINAAPEIHNIGDSFSSGKVFEAVKGGFAIGRSL
jgi:2-enoate reductase